MITEIGNATPSTESHTNNVTSNIISANIYKHIYQNDSDRIFTSNEVTNAENELIEYYYFGTLIDGKIVQAHKNSLYAWQAGKGKSEIVVNTIADNPELNYIFFCNNHKQIAEMYRRIKKRNSKTECTIIEGFGRCCQIITKYENDLQNNLAKALGKKKSKKISKKEHDKIVKDTHSENPKYKEVKKLQNKKVFPSNICMMMKCDVKRCKYKEQWKEIKDDDGEICTTVLAPLNHIPIFNFTDYDHVFFDESIDANGNYKYNYEKPFAVFALKKLQPAIQFSFYYRLLEAINNEDGEYILKHSTYLDMLVFKYNKHICKEFENEKYTKIAKKLIKIRFSQIALFFTYKKQHNESEVKFLNENFEADDLKECIEVLQQSSQIKLTWHQLIMYKQLTEGNDITFMDTTLQFTKDRFMREIIEFQKMFPDYRTTIDYRYTNSQNEKSVIKFNFMQGNFKSYMDSYMKKMKKKVRKDIDNHRQNNPKGKICILTYKDLITKDEKPDPNKMYKFMGVDAFWFYGSGGHNTFNGYDLLIVLGTPMPPENWYTETWEKLYPNEKFPDNTNFSENDTNLMWKLPEDERLQQMFKEEWFGEVYNMVHRVRPLQNNVTIKWYGKNLPEQLANELAVEPIMN